MIGVNLWYIKVVYIFIPSKIERKCQVLTCGILRRFISSFSQESKKMPGFTLWYIKVVYILLLSRIEPKCLMLTDGISRLLNLDSVENRIKMTAANLWHIKFVYVMFQSTFERKRLALTCGISRSFILCFCRESNKNDMFRPVVFQDSLYLATVENRTKMTGVNAWYIKVLYILHLSRIEPKRLVLTCYLSMLFLYCFCRESKQNDWCYSVKVVSILLLPRIEPKQLVLTCGISMLCESWFYRESNHND